MTNRSRSKAKANFRDFDAEADERNAAAGLEPIPFRLGGVDLVARPTQALGAMLALAEAPEFDSVSRREAFDAAKAYFAVQVSEGDLDAALAAADEDAISSALEWLVSEYLERAQALARHQADALGAEAAALDSE